MSKIINSNNNYNADESGTVQITKQQGGAKKHEPVEQDSSELKSSEIINNNSKSNKKTNPKIHTNSETNTINTPSYGKSSNGIDCIGPCYSSGIEIIHPVTLKTYTNKRYNFCPIQPKFDQNTKKIMEADHCQYAETKKELFTPSIFDITAPSINFSTPDFLKIYYKIHSLEEAVMWVDEHINSSPYNTIRRIIDCALGAYGKNNINTMLFIDFVQRVATKFWLDEFNKTPKQQIKEITTKTIESMLKKYASQYSETWEDVLFHFRNIKKTLRHYLKKI